jgi:hypothetical protein
MPGWLRNRTRPDMRTSISERLPNRRPSPFRFKLTRSSVVRMSRRRRDDVRIVEQNVGPHALACAWGNEMNDQQVHLAFGESLEGVRALSIFNVYSDKAVPFGTFDRKRLIGVVRTSVPPLSRTFHTSLWWAAP